MEQTWNVANQHYLSAALAVVKVRLVERIKATDQLLDHPVIATVCSLAEAEQVLADAIAALPAPAALQQLTALCRLSAFEQEILLLCAGMELDATFAPLFAAIQGDRQRNYPTFSVALATLSTPSWGALAPNAPLRYWQLVEVGTGRALTLSPLRIDERVVNFLTGVYHLDERLMGLVKPLQNPGRLVPSHQAIAEQLAHTWAQAKALGSDIPVLQLCGGEEGDRGAIAQATAAQLGLHLHVMAVSSLPSNIVDLNRLARRWHREAIFSQSALLLEWEPPSDATSVQALTVAQFVDDLNSPLLLSCPQRQSIPKHTVVSFDVALPTDAEQRHLWGTALGLDNPNLNGQVHQLVTQFNLNGNLIKAAYARAMGQFNQLGDDAETASSPPALDSFLWQACRTQARPRMDSHAQRIDSDAVWEDLILPAAQKATLQEIAAHLRQRAKVYGTWGFGGKNQRGLGITALFAGASGTGKTLAAEVLAQTLQLDLYKIDLSSIVSKYIGETEKNLSKIFDAAELGGAILLFDEADALFGKRNEVKDSHDRYANIEVSYLLQRMESYRGLAILTTNLPDSIDKAFIRRIRFIVQFPFPEVAERQAIWSRMFPPQTPTEGLDFKKLARLMVAGGNIRNIALNAAFLAADKDESVMMKHILQSARSEYTKLDRPMTESEIRGWVTAAVNP